jgi:uncharacterized protein YjbI with pentapeptide repeats
MVKSNFIFASLCDNDFSSSLLNGICHIAINANLQQSVLSEEDFKYFLVHYIVFDQVVRFPCA